MVFDLPKPPRRLTTPDPAPVAEDALTEEELRLLDDPDFVAAFIAWRDAR